MEKQDSESPTTLLDSESPLMRLDTESPTIEPTTMRIWTNEHLPEEEEEEDLNTKIFRQIKVEICLIQYCVKQYQ